MEKKSMIHIPGDIFSKAIDRRSGEKFSLLFWPHDFESLDMTAGLGMI